MIKNKKTLKINKEEQFKNSKEEYHDDKTQSDCDIRRILIR